MSGLMLGVAGKGVSVRFTLLRVAMSLLALGALVVMTPAAGAPALGLVTIAFDPPGEDRKPEPNRDLNKEFVVIGNSSSRTRSIGGWRVHDRGRRFVFLFSRESRLGPGDRVVLHTGRGKSVVAVRCNGACVATHHLFMGLARYVWDNGGDTATLRDETGRIIEQCTYRARAKSPARC